MVTGASRAEAALLVIDAKDNRRISMVNDFNFNWTTSFRSYPRCGVSVPPRRVIEAPGVAASRRPPR